MDRWVGGLVGRWVRGSVGKWSVVGWSVVGGSVLAGFNKTLFKHQLVIWNFFNLIQNLKLESVH